MSVTIEIPSGPAYSISPNSRKHWRVKHRESQELKQIAFYSSMNGELVYGPVNLYWTIYLGKGRREMDRDNATATLKPAMDGLVQSGAIEGDTSKIVRAITVDQVKWMVHKGPPKIVVTITPV